MTPVMKTVFQASEELVCSLSIYIDDQFHSKLSPLGSHLLWVFINSWEYQLHLRPQFTALYNYYLPLTK